MLDLRTISGAMLASQTGLSASTVLILMGVVTAFLLMHHSSKHNEAISRQEAANKPHAMIDNSPSSNVVGWSILIIVVFVLVAALQR